MLHRPNSIVVPDRTMPSSLKSSKLSNGPAKGTIAVRDAISTIVVAVMMSYQAGKAATGFLQNTSATPRYTDMNGALKPLLNDIDSHHHCQMKHVEDEPIHNHSVCDLGENVIVDDECQDDEDEDSPIERFQLLADFRHVSMKRINSTEEVAQRMSEIVDIFDSEVIAYSCCDSENGDIACSGILEENGHISLHAWPREQTALLDLYLDESDIVDALNLVSNVFYPGLPNKFNISHFGLAKESSIEWSLRHRGSQETATDLHFEMGETGVLKSVVASVKTEFQKVDIVDFVPPKKAAFIQELVEKDPSYFFANPHLLSPNRALFLDGVVQSTRSGDAPYHEALVHPSMFTHRHPKRVAIIGGGECATLREVLKHNTVETVTMIEIDAGVIEAAHFALPEWTDCSNLQGSSRYCIDDPRAIVHNEDAFAWFIDRFLEPNAPKEAHFDIIIVDALDPQNVVDFAKALYGDNSFLNALYNALSPEGILVTQVGNAPAMDDPPEHLTTNSNREIFANTLAEQGFESIADYNEAHAEFEEPWYFYVAFKSRSSRTDWHASEAHFNLEMRKRGVPTIDGSNPFQFFDGATMLGYQYPTKASVQLYCRREPRPSSCENGHGFNPEQLNIPEDSFFVKKSMVGDRAGRGVYARVKVPRESYLMLEKSIHPVVVEPNTVSLIQELDDHPIADDYYHFCLDAFVEGYGYSSTSFGRRERVLVDSGKMTFVNHGCNGTANLGEYPNITDSTVEKEFAPTELLKYSNVGREYVFNPAHVRDTGSAVSVVNSVKEIQVGEEVLENYYEQFNGVNEWKNQVSLLQHWCSGGIGDVEEYQEEHRERSSSG